MCIHKRLYIPLFSLRHLDLMTLIHEHDLWYSEDTHIPEMKFIGRVCNTRGNGWKLNKCHIISNRDGHFLVIVSLMRGIHFPIILLILQLSLVLSTDLPKLILHCSAVFICCCNLCYYFLGHLLVQLVLPLCPVDTFVLVLCHIHWYSALCRK